MSVPARIWAEVLARLMTAAFEALRAVVRGMRVSARVESRGERRAEVRSREVGERTSSPAAQHRSSSPRLSIHERSRESVIEPPRVNGDSERSWPRRTRRGQDDAPAARLGRVLLHRCRRVLDGNKAAVADAQELARKLAVGWMSPRRAALRRPGLVADCFSRGRTSGRSPS